MVVFAPERTVEDNPPDQLALLGHEVPRRFGQGRFPALGIVEQNATVGVVAALKDALKGDRPCSRLESQLQQMRRGAGSPVGPQYYVFDNLGMFNPQGFDANIERSGLARC